MAAISIEIDTKRADLFLRAFPEQTTRAINHALKRARERTQTRANRVISQDMGLKVSDVRSRIRVIESDLAFELRASLKRIPLIEFGASGPEPSRGKGRGVSYRTGSRGRGRNPNAFITTVGGGRHRGVFKRRGPARLPIAELFGPSLGRVMDRHRSEIVSVGQTTFVNELHRLLGLVLKRVSAGFGGGDAA